MSSGVTAAILADAKKKGGIPTRPLRPKRESVLRRSRHLAGRRLHVALYRPCDVEAVAALVGELGRAVKVVRRLREHETVVRRGPPVLEVLHDRRRVLVRTDGLLERDLRPAAAHLGVRQLR